MKLRGPVIIVCCLVSLVGYAILYTQTKPGAAYAGAVLAAMGIYPTIAVDMAWVGSAAGGDTRRGMLQHHLISLVNTV